MTPEQVSASCDQITDQLIEVSTYGLFRWIFWKFADLQRRLPHRYRPHRHGTLGYDETGEPIRIRNEWDVCSRQFLSRRRDFFLAHTISWIKLAKMR